MTTSHHNSSPAYYAASESAQEWADAEFGEGWEDRAAEPEYRVRVPEGEVDEHAADRAELARLLDLEAWEGMGS